MKGARIGILLVLVSTLSLSVSCSKQTDYAIWYGTSDRYGIMIAVQQDASAVVVAVIPLAILQNYRDALSRDGISSDALGALQHLFGRPAHHYFRGTKAEWDEIGELLMNLEGLAYGGIRPSVEAMVQVTIRQAEHLSKVGAPDTLRGLAAVKTESSDIENVLQSLAQKKPLVRVYDAGRFLPSRDMAPESMRKWMNAWTELILHEARQSRGVEKDVR